MLTSIIGFITLKNIFLLYLIGCLLSFGMTFSLMNGSKKSISIPKIKIGYYFIISLASWYMVVIYVKAFIKGLFSD